MYYKRITFYPTKELPNETNTRARGNNQNDGKLKSFDGSGFKAVTKS